jgi:hypothetical protein
LQSTNAGSADGFLSRLSRNGATLEFSTYLGGTFTDALWDVSADPTGNIHFTGESFSATFPGITTNVLQSANGGLSDVVIGRLAADGALYTSFFGSAGEDLGYGIATDTAGNAYLTGRTRSPAFPIGSTNVAQAAYGGGVSDGFVLKVTHEPELVAALAGEAIEVSWPSPNPQFVLETAPSIPREAAWTPANSEIEIIDGRHRARLPMAASNLLFRLRWDPTP